MVYDISLGISPNYTNTNIYIAENFIADFDENVLRAETMKCFCCIFSTFETKDSSYSIKGN